MGSHCYLTVIYVQAHCYLQQTEEDTKEKALTFKGAADLQLPGTSFGSMVALQAQISHDT